MRKRNIDWSYWLAMPEVRVWEAILLSLNIEPDSVRDVWNDDILDPLSLVLSHSELASEYKKRLRLLCANRHEPALFTPGTIRMDKPEECGVRLVEVGAWLVKLNRTPTIPEELAAAVVSAGGRSKDTEEEGPLERESVASIVYNRSEPPEWDHWSKCVTLTARQAVLLIHGFNPMCHKTGPLVLTTRERSLPGTDARVRDIEHQLVVAESTSTIARSAASWLEWFSDKYPEWEVTAEFRQLAAAQLTPAPVAKGKKHVQKEAHNRDEILRVIDELGYQRLALPPNKPGKPGVKAAVWAKVEPSHTITSGAFTKAWGMLLKDTLKHAK